MDMENGWNEAVRFDRDIQCEGYMAQDPVVVVDEKASEAAFMLAKEIFDGIVEVRMRTWWFWSSHMALAYANFRGGGLGLTDSLHTDRNHVTLKTMWGLCEAQECGEISPEMFHEFIYSYHRQTAELFGLTCYACCEGIDEKWEWVKELPNLWRVSISQWSDMAKMSDYLKGDFIYSYKANSAHVTVPDMNEEVIQGELRRMFEKNRENHVEVVLKDLHTISNKPEQVIRWVQIVREELERVY